MVDRLKCLLIKNLGRYIEESFAELIKKKIKTFHQPIKDRLKRDILLQILIDINTVANVCLLLI